MMEKIPALMELTGLEDFEKAKRVLELHKFNMDAAVNHILDETNDNYPSTSNGTTTMETIDLESEVRAPIPKKRELLVTPDADNFLIKRRRVGVQRLIPLRNFAREGELAETEDSGSPSKKRLEDMFRPPIAILTAGSYEYVRKRAESAEKWLLINLQDNTCFPSQCLNRDCWNDKHLQYFIKKYFLFMQIGIDTTDGGRFSSFYKVTKCPFICVLDPRTGGNQQTIPIKDNLNGKELIVELYEFIRLNGKYPDSGEPTDHNGHYRVDIPATIMPPDFYRLSDLSRPSSSKTTHENGKSATMDLTEDQQMELAIEYSLAITISDSDESAEEKEVEEDDEVEAVDVISTPAEREPTEADNVENYKKYLGAETDSHTQLHCRFPADKKTTLKWPASSKLKALKLYLNANHREITEAPHKILMTYPRRDLCLEDDDASLEKLGLHPSATLFIQPDD